MALIHNATLTPNKLQLLTEWLPTRTWYAPAGELRQVARFRFDDPANAVGVETILVRAGDPVYQVPLTYRHAPLPGGEDYLLGTAEHSALGKRWIYDATGDPVYAATLAAAILANTGQAELLLQVGDRLERREPSINVASNGQSAAPAVGRIERVVDGDPTTIETDTVELTILRRLGTSLDGTVLRGDWPDQPTPMCLASATLR